MSRLSLETPNQAQTVVEGLYRDLERRIAASPPGLCPVDISLGFLKLCHAQTCGKCSPCRIGLGQLARLMDDVLSERATLETIDRIERTAKAIVDTADCAIGYEAAGMVLRGVQGFRDDYIEHVTNNRCTSGLTQPVPCVSLCPAHVDVPGYIALVKAGRYQDAVKLIRKDNPFPTACAFICEHPCEARCRRNMVDDAVNICGIKHFAVTHALHVSPSPNQPPTGKRVAIIGGGPGGLSCAFYLQLMGHHCVVFEQRPKLGGMLRYGIPRYRLPEDMLENDIDVILSTGVEIHTDISVGRDISFHEIEEQYDAVFLCIGAHVDRKIGIPGEDSIGVLSAVELLRDIGEGNVPDLSGKRVCVIGGGNVSMDATRTAIRLGAQSVTTVYRRRVDDMTALSEEIEEAASEGATILPLQAPLRIERDEDGHVTALVTTPQHIGPVGGDGRPKPVPAKLEEKTIPCDIVIVAIGQGIDSKAFTDAGVQTNRDRIRALPDSIVEGGSNKLFAGGDAVTGPSTVIRAIAAGKVAAANIDNFLGYNHVIHATIEDIPEAPLSPAPACGRVNLRTRPACECIDNFEDIKEGMTEEEVLQEASRCLRCDHYGYGNFRGGRMRQW